MIMGEDMVRRGDKWVFRRGKERKEGPESDIKRVERPGSFDPKVSASGVGDDDFARLVRQAYQVLLTRASRATVLYSTDKETRDYLKAWAGKVEIHGLRPTYENLPKEARPPHLPKAKRRRNRKRGRVLPTRDSSDGKNRRRGSGVAGSPGPPHTCVRRAGPPPRQGRHQKTGDDSDSDVGQDRADPFTTRRLVLDSGHVGLSGV